MTEPSGPIGAALRAHAEREQRATEQPVRHTADTITDNDLDGLYERIATLQAQLVIDQQRIARVRQLAADWTVLRTHGSAAYELRAALDEPKEQ